jgi:threonine synthase
VKASIGPAFKERHRIGAVNSINWARVVAQVVYYFKGYFAATQQQRRHGVVLRSFGKLRQHLCRLRREAHGTSDSSARARDQREQRARRVLRTGRYRPRKASEVHATSSPSMDISKASNFERFIWDSVGGDGDKVAWLWRQVEEGGGFDLSTDSAWEKIEEDSGFVSGRSTHADRINTIREVKKKYGQVIDPHTADGVRGRAPASRAPLSDDLPGDSAAGEIR